MRKMKRYDWLCQLVNQEGYTIGAEIGAATGNTTRRLLTRCKTLDKLYVADIWKALPGSGQWEMDNMEEIFRDRFMGEPRLTILKGLSWEMADQVDDDSLDFIFIDADHSYECVKKDIHAWYPKLRKGGTICGHDINLDGVRQAVKEFFPRYINTKIDNVWMA